MSKRTFCDACGSEITNENGPGDGLCAERTFRHEMRRVSVAVRVLLIPPPAGPTPDVCRHCIIDTLAQLDARPQAATAGETA